MPQQGVKRRLATSRIAEFLCSHPRLTAFLLVTLLLIAVQGSAAASDSDLTVGTDDFQTSDDGPSDGS